MTAILYDDIVETAITKLQALLDARTESYTSDVTVSNRVLPGVDRMVTVEYAGGPGERNTFDISVLAVNVYCTSEGDATDLARMTRALITGRGTGTLCDGDPITYTDTNVGPTPIENGTDQRQFRMLFHIQHRGVQLTA